MTTSAARRAEPSSRLWRRGLELLDDAAQSLRSLRDSWASFGARLDAGELVLVRNHGAVAAVPVDRARR